MSITIDIRGLDETIRYFEEFPKQAQQAARLAVNAATRYAARQASKEIRKQVAFKRSYLGAATNANARLRIRKFAKGNDLVAVLAARQRATSLARFTTGSPRFGRQRRAPSVKVSASGGRKRIPGSFYVPLRSGKSFDEDNFNVGLALRLKPGQRLRHKRRMAAFGGGLYLLYGPSVDQVFRSVRDDISEDVAAYAGREFLRQFGRFAIG